MPSREPVAQAAYMFGLSVDTSFSNVCRPLGINPREAYKAPLATIELVRARRDNRERQKKLKLIPYKGKEHED